jgi:hypothetical protein
LSNSSANVLMVFRQWSTSICSGINRQPSRIQAVATAIVVFLYSSYGFMDCDQIKTVTRA